MSSLEERREARRRKRLEEEAATVNGGDDDLERRRRERREARLRGGGDSAADDTSSRRSRRNRGGDDDTPAEETTSTRSRRRRGGDDEDAPEPAPEPEEAAEEPAPAPAPQEEDDSAAREAEEAERRRKAKEEEEEEERRRQQEEMRKQQQEEQRRREEERRKAEEEEERKRKRCSETEVRSVVTSSPDSGHPSLYSPSPHAGGGGPRGFPPPPHSAQASVLSDGVFSFTSDDALHDLTSDPQRLMDSSSDYDLGSSFDDFLLSDPDLDPKSPRTARSDSRKRRARVGKSPHPEHLAPKIRAEGKQECSVDSSGPCPPEQYSADVAHSAAQGQAHPRVVQKRLGEDPGALCEDSGDVSPRKSKRLENAFEESPDSLKPGGEEVKSGEERDMDQHTALTDSSSTAAASLASDCESLTSEEESRSSLQSHHQRSESLPEDVGILHTPGHERSASSPSSSSPGVQQSVSSRRRELQQQLQVRKEDGQKPSLRKMHSQGDLSPSTRTGSQISDILSQLSNRLKKRDGRQGRPQHQQFSIYRCQSEPLVASMPGQMLAESPRASSRRLETSQAVRRTTLSSQRDRDLVTSVVVSASSEETSTRSVFIPEHDLDPSLHAAPPASTSTSIPSSSVPPPAPDPLPPPPSHLPEGGPEELRLCLDFLHEPADSMDTEAGLAESRPGAECGGQGDVCGGHQREPSDSVLDPCDIPPPPEYCDSDDVASDVLGGGRKEGEGEGVGSDVVDNAGQVPGWGRAGQGGQGVSLSQIVDQEEVPFMTRLLKSVMTEQGAVSRSPSPPLPPPPDCSSFPSVSPPPPLSWVTGALVDTPRMTPPPPLPPEFPPPPPISGQGGMAPNALSRHLLLPSCPTPPPPPPPPPCDQPSVDLDPPEAEEVENEDDIGSGNAGEGEVPLPPPLCEDMDEQADRQGKADFQSDISSLESYSSFIEHANEDLRRDSLIRPSALKEGEPVRDWGGGIAASTPRSQVCVSARFSHETQHNSRKKRQSLPTDVSFERERERRRQLEGKEVSKHTQGQLPNPGGNRRGRTHSVDWFLEEDEVTKIEERLRLWKESRTSKLKPLSKSKSAVEFETSTRASVDVHSWVASTERPQSCRVYRDSEMPSQAKAAMSDLSQHKTAPRSPSVDSRSDSSQREMSLQSPCAESKAVVEHVKRKIPPPTLPKSASLAQVQRSRGVIPEDSPTGQVLRQCSHSRFNSTSSVDSEVFALSRQQSTSDVQNGEGSEAERVSVSSAYGHYPPPPPPPQHSASGAEKRFCSPRVVHTDSVHRSSLSSQGSDRRYSSVESTGEALHVQTSSRRVERRHSLLEGACREERKFSSVEAAQRSFERRDEHKKFTFETASVQRYPSTESSQFNGVRHSSSDSSRGVRRTSSFAGTARGAERSFTRESPPAVPGRYSTFESNRKSERRYSSIDSAKTTENNGFPGTDPGRRHSSIDHVQRQETTTREGSFPENRIQSGKKGNLSRDEDTMEAVRRRLSVLSRETQDREEAQSAHSAVQRTGETVDTAPSPVDCGLRKKQGAPKPRFDARRLTQGSEIPVMWKCAEDAMTEYVPPPTLHPSNAHSEAGSLKAGPGITRAKDLAAAEDGRSDYSSWAADFVRDRIASSEGTPVGSRPERGLHTPDSPLLEAEAVSADSDGPRTCVSARASPSTQSKLMSITDRIGLLNKPKDSKPAPASVAELKAGFMSDRSGPGQKPVIKAQAAATTPEQKRFASLLQNKLINIIVEDDADAQREKQREKERGKRTPSVKKKLTPAQEIARSRAMALGSRKPVRADLPQWNPDAAPKAAPTSRDVYDSIKMGQEKSGSVKDLAKEFTHLSDVVNEEEVEKRRENVRRRRSRRLTTGLSVKDMKDMFDQSDSNPSSANSTRANTPRPMPPISERIVERFDTPAIAENRPLTDKGMVRISRYGSHSSVSDIVHKVESSAKDPDSPLPRRSARTERSLAGSPSAKPSPARTGALTTEDQVAAVRKPRMDKSRRFTTGVNFEELQLRFTQPENYRKHNQSRAMSAIFASSQDISRRHEVQPRSSARSMENLSLSEAPASTLRILPPRRWDTASESVADLSREPSLLEKRRVRSCAEESPLVSAPDIQSTCGSAFSRVSSMRSPIKEGVPSRQAVLGERRPSLVERYPLDALAEEERLEAERAERERKEQEEEERRKEEEEKKKKKKRKGLGGLSPEKKKLLKKLIMQKAAEDLRNEAKAKAEEKEKYINERVTPLKADGLGQAELQNLVKELHSKVAVLEEEVYDWEIKIRKQDFEINELTLKVNDTKGKFIKPVLRKVNKTESKLTKLQTKESRDFRGNLKSTGQNKFALKEEDETSKQPEWRKDLKHDKEGEGEGAGEEVPAES